MTGDRVTSHVAAFNDAVRSGDWIAFSRRFADDATLAFDGVPVGPFHGRDAIAAAYAAHPPTDTMDVLQVDTDGERDLVRFAWRAGGRHGHDAVDLGRRAGGRAGRGVRRLT